jgi:DNA-binding transcriptional LysR family regulator
MAGELGAYASGLRGHIRLMSNTAALTEFLPEALSRFLTVHPNVDVDLEERPSDFIVESVAQGAADLGVVADIVDLGKLECRPFCQDQLVAVLPKARRPSMQGRAVAFEEIMDEDFVGLAHGNPLQDHIIRQAARLGRSLTFRIRLNSLDAVCAFVAQGVGIGIVPESTARRCRRTLPIFALRITDPWALRTLTICARRFDDLAPHTRELVRSLTEKTSRNPQSKL